MNVLVRQSLLQARLKLSPTPHLLPGDLFGSLHLCQRIVGGMALAEVRGHVQG